MKKYYLCRDKNIQIHLLTKQQLFYEKNYFKLFYACCLCILAFGAVQSDSGA